MPHLRPEARQVLPRGITRPGAMKGSVAILACAAALMAVQKRGLLDLGHVAHEVLGWSSHALALAGVVYLIHIWWADRFRVSIGRSMVVVALVAVLFQSV